MNKWLDKTFATNEKFGPSHKYDITNLSSDWTVKKKVEKDIVLDTNKKLGSMEKAHKRA